MFNIRRFAAFAGAWKTHKRSMARHWTRDELKKHQQERLVSLVTHAVHKSAFYRELYHNIKISGGFCLTDLPVIDKSLMMENYDRFVTDPRLSLAGLRAHLQEISHDDLYVDQYRILTSSGSTGLRGNLCVQQAGMANSDSHRLADISLRRTQGASFAHKMAHGNNRRGKPIACHGPLLPVC